MIRWWWIRHAPVVAEEARRVYGSRDVDADLTVQPERLVWLAGILPDGAIWLRSGLGRAQQTLQGVEAVRAAFGRPNPGPVGVEADLGEQDFGDWQGMERREAYRMIGSQLPGSSGMALRPADFAPPGGESFVQLCRRVDATVLRIAAEHGRATGPSREPEPCDIVCFAHGGTIRAALRLALAAPHESALRFAVDHCALTRIDQIDVTGDGTWRLVSVNRLPETVAD